MPEESSPHHRRPRYRGTHPRHFAEKYKELDPLRYNEEIQKVMGRGHTPAGMHRPICVNEILEILHPMPGERGIDATLGFGGHSSELLKRIAPNGHLWSLDVDPLELPRTEARLRNLGFDQSLLTVRRMNFAGIGKLQPELGDGCDFFLADLGISSMQLDNPERGFTFKQRGPLDLRLNPERGQSAAALLKSITAKTLAKILTEHSDEPNAEQLAQAIFTHREKINTTTDLSEVIQGALNDISQHIPEQEITKTMQRTFQALRIAVNDEFSALDQLLRNLPTVMKPGGRVAILTFHSGEDNRVIRAFEAGKANGIYEAISEEAIRPSVQERYDNPRSKCARLRWAIKK